ncbi:transposase [Mesorhizobium sp. M0904]|uniref:transposase n=1 Tax=Mesorhizobium sp. M0904 TaxID=2957022 RepID=UPI00333D9410
MHLADNRASCTGATANQFRLFLRAGAWSAMGRRSGFAVARFGTLRVRLIKIAARVVKDGIANPSAPSDIAPRPDQRILQNVLDRIPQLAT